MRCVIQRQLCRDVSDLHRLFVRERVDVEDAWAIFEQKARFKNRDSVEFAERLASREPQYRQRWQEELSDLEPNAPPFDEVIRQLRRGLRDHLQRYRTSTTPRPVEPLADCRFCFGGLHRHISNEISSVIYQARARSGLPHRDRRRSNRAQPRLPRARGSRDAEARASQGARSPSRGTRSHPDRRRCRHGHLTIRSRSARERRRRRPGSRPSNATPPHSAKQWSGGSPAQDPDASNQDT